MRGITLIELLIALAILALVFVVVGICFISAQTAYQKQTIKVELIKEAQWAMKFICNELRGAQLNSIPSGWNRDYIRFRLRGGTQIIYQRDSTQPSLLCRCEGTGTCQCSTPDSSRAPMAQFVRSINFQRELGEKVVEITLTLEKDNYFYTLHSGVKPRN